MYFPFHFTLFSIQLDTEEVACKFPDGSVVTVALLSVSMSLALLISHIGDVMQYLPFSV